MKHTRHRFPTRQRHTDDNYDYDLSAYDHDYDLNYASHNIISLEATDQSANALIPKRLTFSGEFAPYTSSYHNIL